MGWTRTFVRRERGGIVLWTLVALILVAGAYYGYKAFVFYRANVAPAVAEVAKVAGAVKSVLPTFEVTRDPEEVATVLLTMLRIAPPAGYAGAFGITFEVLGKSSQVVALIPEGVPAEQIFEGGKGEIRFNPGPHTIFLAARSDTADREEMRAAIAKMVAGDAQTGTLQPVHIAAGGKRVAAYVGTAENFGTRNRLVFVFLDDGRLLHAVGPADAFDDEALVRALAAVVATHPANDLLYVHPKADTTVAARSDPCGIAGLPDDFDVVVVSVYKGSTPLDVAIDRGGHDVTREEVVVGATPKPVVLVLMGYDPIVWNVGQTADANIAGILAQGAHRQAVIGVPKSTPMVSYSSGDGPNACRSFRTGRADDPALGKRVRELFGRGVATFLDRKAGPRFVVGEVAGEAEYSPEITLASVVLPGNVMPGGQRGIDRLVREKSLRLATEGEVAAWVNGAARQRGRSADEVRRGMGLSLRGEAVYFVLGDFELPPGLYGAHSRTFLVPAGATPPSGERAHNTFLTMDGFSCYGAGCR